MVYTEQSQTFSVPEEQAGQRLDHYLVGMLDGLSRTTIQRIIAGGQVLVNGRSMKAGYLLRVGDTIDIIQSARETQPAYVLPHYVPLDIIYEDEDILVVNKPAGMVVHPAPGHTGDTLVNALLARYPELGRGADDQRPGIVHRLDKDTSGLIIVAKNARAHAALVEQMKQHAIIKRYQALVEGVVPHDSGSIDAPIGRDPRYRQQMAITTTASREARTHFRVLQRFNRHTLLLVQLETGRTHQIRVHLQAIGHPVVGDPVYGPRSKADIPLHRQFLHASQLVFRHPLTGKTMELEAPLPDDLEHIIQKSSL